MARTMGILLAGTLLLAGLGCAQPVDVVQGNWEGAFTKKALAGKPVAAQIIAEGRGRYRGLFLVPTDDEAPRIARWITGQAKGDKVLLDGNVDLGEAMGGACDVKLQISDGKLKGEFKGKGSPGKFEMTRVEKKSPTLGAKAPEGAVVLFDGTNVDAWVFKKTPWAIVEGGAMEVRPGNMHSKQEFGDAQIHVEFRTPFMPGARGQARGNSGVYVAGRYEVQVLDSFGLDGRDNECGGIYKKGRPKVNACLPPLEWQTYDITYQAPRFDASGKKTANAVLSVKHNGILIHDKLELDGVCGGGMSNTEAATGPLWLQDHHNKVQYRNIWVKPL